MIQWIRKHRETLFVIMLGLCIMAAFNVMMIQWHTEMWTRSKVGFWAAFYNRFEISGFDPYTYITISKWRPLYVLSRHPILAAMMWPLSELNEWLKHETGKNCTIYIVAVIWTIVSTCSWTLMYRIVRDLCRLTFQHSLLLTFFFFGFSHVMLTTFVPDHMTLSLPLILIAVYLGGKAIQQQRTMPLWQSLPLAFLATGVTTTNIVKIGFADLLTRFPSRQRFTTSYVLRLVGHYLLYIVPLAMLYGAYVYQEDTTQREEYDRNEQQMAKKAAKDSIFAKEWHDQKELKKEAKLHQTVNISIASNTEYFIDRWPSLQENIFGEGIMLHPADSYGIDNVSGAVIHPTPKHNFVLRDANRCRPALVRYSHWWFYLFEVMTVSLFLCGIWYGRRERLMWMTISMFLFDMLLHVGLNFASADVYIMTVHWAFVIPIAIAYLLKAFSGRAITGTITVSAVLFLTIFFWWHNVSVIAKYILFS